MGYPFPSQAWLTALEKRLNEDERYAHIARNWEGDLAFVIEPDDPGSSEKSAIFYMDLWHGKCRRTAILEGLAPDQVALRLTAPRKQFLRVVSGELDPMQAMLTRRLRVEGDMTKLLKNVPVVLDFVRCAKSVGVSEPEGQA